MSVQPTETPSTMVMGMAKQRASPSQAVKVQVLAELHKAVLPPMQVIWFSMQDEFGSMVLNRALRALAEARLLSSVSGERVEDGLGIVVTRVGSRVLMVGVALVSSEGSCEAVASVPGHMTVV